MPPRLGCKKSRNGCIRCKSRKVKCDEQLPTCGACKLHVLPCEYPKRRHGAHKPIPERYLNGSSPATINLSASPSTPNQDVTDENLNQRRLLELGLLHYYVTIVAPTFLYIDHDYGLKLHAVKIPQVALQNSNLLNAMFAYALLHMHVEAIQRKFPDNVEFFEGLGLQIPRDHGAHTPATGDQPPQTELLVLHSDYLDKALSEQRNAVAEISDQNADAACLTSILIGMTALVHASQQVHAGEDADYSTPMQWFNLSRSFSAVLDASRSLLSPESATTKMINANPHPPEKRVFPVKTSNFRYLLDWQPRRGIEPLDEATTAAYETAVSHIETVYQWVVDNQPREALGRLILAFPNLVSDSFVAFVDQGRPRALVLLAHLLAMSKNLDQSWWIFRGVADFHVKGIATLVPDEWQWTLAWPLQILSTGMV